MGGCRMGGSKAMCETGLVLTLRGSAGTSEIPQGLLYALRVFDQERGEDAEQDALQGVVDNLVEWFLCEPSYPRSNDGA